jgi:hypothetical protein
VWPRQHVVYLSPDPDASQAALPRMDILLTVGLGFLGPKGAAGRAAN